MINNHASSEGLLHELIRQKEAELMPKRPFLKGAAILGVAAIAAHEIEQADTNTRSFNVFSLAPLIWSALGALSSVFLLYQFVGHEMGIIIETKATLKKLAYEIEIWQKLIPELQHNQLEVAQKMKIALDVLDTVVPLVNKLAAESSHTLQSAHIGTPAPITNNTVQINEIKKELANLKIMVQAIASTQTQGATVSPATTQKIKYLSKISEKLFGKKRQVF